jgi:hypothetical protein
VSSEGGRHGADFTVPFLLAGDSNVPIVHSHRPRDRATALYRGAYHDLKEKKKSNGASGMDGQFLEEEIPGVSRLRLSARTRGFAMSQSSGGGGEEGRLDPDGDAGDLDPGMQLPSRSPGGALNTLHDTYERIDSIESLFSAPAISSGA